MRSVWQRLHDLVAQEGTVRPAARWGVCPVCNLTIHRGDLIRIRRGRVEHEDCSVGVDDTWRRHPSNRGL